MPKLKTIIDFLGAKSNSSIIKTARELNSSTHDIRSIIRNIKPNKLKETIAKKELTESYEGELAKYKLEGNDRVFQTSHHPDGTIKFDIELLKFIKGTKNVPNRIDSFLPGGDPAFPGRLTRNKLSNDGQVFDISNTRIDFWATFESLNESVAPQWESKIYFGRTEGVHHLMSTERILNLNFTIQANNEKEHENNFKRLNFLTKLNFPGKIIVDGNSNLMSRQPPLIRINIGDLYKDQFAIITSFDKDWDPNIPWANTINELPIVTKITLSLTLLHEEQPTFDTDFHTFTNRTI